jgi:hypothetical protein
MNDQENIKQLQQVDSRTGMIKKAGREEEWKQIHLEMEAGSSDIIPKRNYFLKSGKMASVLQGLKKELQNQGDAVAEFETQDWQDEGEWIAQGWCEALAFAIKLIEEHNKSCEADQ